MKQPTMKSLVIAGVVGLAAWYEYSTKNYTGWPTATNQYNNPVPNDPYILATVLHLKPVG